MKILKNNILVISMLKRHNGVVGPGESAGLRLGDIIFGSNFRPCVEGVRSLLHGVKYSLRIAQKTLDMKGNNSNKIGEIEETPLRIPVITLQCWRCHQLCSDPVPGRLFPRADDIFVQGYSLFRSRVLSEWERWNFNEILLNFMKKELKIRLEDEIKIVRNLGSNPRIRVVQNDMLDLERNILRSKGLRTALCVRIVHTKFVDEAVLYVLRVEDEESGLQWNVQKRYNDFYSLHKELTRLSKYLNDLQFPKKRIVHSRLSLRVIEERIVALEQYIRHAVHRLTIYSTSDAQASLSLRKIQEFLDVEMFIDCLKPPPVDDQRYLELMTYRRLNDFTSLSCQQCIRFVDTVDLDALAQNDKSNGYLPMLELVAQALREVEQYAMQHYGQQMCQILKDRRPTMDEDRVRSFVTKCVRRQVEGAIYLPLRRAIFRIVYSFIADKAERLQKAMKILKLAPVKTFFEKGNYDDIHKVNSLSFAVESFKNLMNAFLPSDQGNMLMKAAAAVMEVISEMEAIKKGEQHETSIPDRHTCVGDTNNRRKTIDIAPTPSKAVEMKNTGSGMISSSFGLRSRSLSFMKNESDTQQSSEQSLSSDLLSKRILADPAGTIFSAAEHVLVNKRNFDKEGVNSTNEVEDDEEECDSDNDSFSYIHGASEKNDSFRELYSILKAEGRRGDEDSKHAHRLMRDAATANRDERELKGTQIANKSILKDLLKTTANQEQDSSHDSNSVSDGNESPRSSSSEGSRSEMVVGISNKRAPSSVNAMDLTTRDSSAWSQKSPDPGLGISPSIEALISASSSAAIRGSSVSLLDDTGTSRLSLYRPSEQRINTYTSPYKSKKEAEMIPTSSNDTVDEVDEFSHFRPLIYCM